MALARLEGRLRDLIIGKSCGFLISVQIEAALSRAE
jgi:hypothetical protein